VNLLALADALTSIGTVLAEAGALAAPVQPDIPPPPRHVDCGECRACCHMAVFLRPEEDGYDVQPGTRILQRREADGACVYLDAERGCTIYDRRPVACRAFACVDFVRHAYGDRPAPADEHPQFQRVIAEGRKRLHEPA
jgi:Fe-S-cluster containining protein